jgi:hypothetical protein
MPGWLWVGVEVAGRCVASNTMKLAIRSPGNQQIDPFLPPSILRMELMSGVEFAILLILQVASRPCVLCY